MAAACKLQDAHPLAQYMECGDLHLSVQKRDSFTMPRNVLSRESSRRGAAERQRRWRARQRVRRQTEDRLRQRLGRAPTEAEMRDEIATQLAGLGLPPPPGAAPRPAGAPPRGAAAAPAPGRPVGGGAGE